MRYFKYLFSTIIIINSLITCIWGFKVYRYFFSNSKGIIFFQQKGLKIVYSIDPRSSNLFPSLNFTIKLNGELVETKFEMSKWA